MLRSGAGGLRRSGARKRRKGRILNFGGFLILRGRRGGTTESGLARFVGRPSGSEIVTDLMSRELSTSPTGWDQRVKIEGRVALLRTGCAREGTVSRGLLRFENAGSGRLGAAPEGESIDATGVEIGRGAPVTIDFMRSSSMR